MNKNTLEMVVLFISLVTFVGGCLAWYSAAVIKAYAAQRDFRLLAKNFEQLSQSQESLMRDVDRGNDALMLEIRELKSQVNVLLVKILPDTSLGTVRSKS